MLNRSPPWYNPLIIFVASALGGAVTGIITLKAVKMTNNSAKERDEQNRKEEARRILTEKRAQAYTNYISSTVHISSLRKAGEKPDEEYFKDWYKSLAEVKLFGSPKVIRAVMVPMSNEDWKDDHKVISYCGELLSLMAEELQGFDVYKEIIQPSEQKASPSDGDARAKS